MQDEEEKSELHPRNPHRFRYDFRELMESFPELENYLAYNRYREVSIDFADPKAVKALNKALLIHYYGIQYWDIPKDFLCPPIPGRADYIHYIGDLLAESNAGKIPEGNKISILDIGVGANCIYPIIGAVEFGWSFVGTDINPLSVESANQIVNKNSRLQQLVLIRLQKDADVFFRGILHKEEYFDATICNPPFHASAKEAAEQSLKKFKNLNAKKGKYKITNPVLNFGGQHAELWYKGGEKLFIQKLIEESVQYKFKCKWFTTLVSKSETLAAVYDALDKVGAVQQRTIEMAQGQKISRIVAWTFLSAEEMVKWEDIRTKNIVPVK